jgi:dihydrodipicolinate synthase/N-acetylneuraminate lyase
MSAILLPLMRGRRVDWTGFEGHVTRTLRAGLTPAVNMDTGYINLLDDDTRLEVLRRARRLAGGREFVAGAFVRDGLGARWDCDGYRRVIDEILDHGGTPVIFQSYGLTSGPLSRVIDHYRQIARHCPRFIAFELGTMFAAFGRIYSLDAYGQLLAIPQCIGAKHSSLNRELEWQRLTLRDAVRPDFRVFSGNDLAIDMVMYGSDYLLGLSTFAPDLFALRDGYWRDGRVEFYELNDVLQYLGFFAFRDPVPAYKHSAAQFLKIRGQICSNATYPGSPRRPASDVAILREIAGRLEAWRSRT